MLHKPHFFKKMKTPETPQPQNPEPEVTRETDERVANEAYIKAFGTVKTLFDASVQIDKKMSDGIEQVDKYWKRYIGVAVAIAVIAAYLGVPYLIKERVTEQYVGEAVQKQVASFTDDKVASLIRESVTEAEKRMDAELELTKKESSELQAAFLSLHGELETFSAEIQEARSRIDVYEQIAAARAGNRVAYDALRRIAKGSNHVAHIASLGVDGIDESYEERRRTWGRARMGLQNLQTGEKGISISSGEAIFYIYTDQKGVCEGALNSLVDRKQLQYVATIIQAVKESKELDCVYAGIRGLEKLLDKQFPALGIDEVLAWWDLHKEDEKYHYSFEKVCEAIKQPNESDESFQWRQAMLWNEWIDEEPEQFWAARHLFELLFPLREDASGNRRRMMLHALEYLQNERPLAKSWYIAKATYLFQYDPNGVIAFINDRLDEDYNFEAELKQYENIVFPKSFFDLERIHWPSRSTMKLQDGGDDTEKAAE